MSRLSRLEGVLILPGACGGQLLIFPEEWSYAHLGLTQGSDLKQELKWRKTNGAEGLPRGLVVQIPPANTGDTHWIHILEDPTYDSKGHALHKPAVGPEPEQENHHNDKPSSITSERQNTQQARASVRCKI